MLITMNDLPVIGYPCLRKELWDRQGTNIAGRKKEMYSEKLFRRPKTRFWRKIDAFSPSFYRKRIWAVLICGKCKFCLNNPKICDCETHHSSPLTFALGSLSKHKF